MTIYQYITLLKDFREATNIKKDQLMTTIGSSQNIIMTMIARLYKQIRSTLPPRTKLELPFELSKTNR